VFPLPCVVQVVSMYMDVLVTELFIAFVVTGCTDLTLNWPGAVIGVTGSVCYSVTFVGHE
jgi:hypothetical protein